MRKLKLSELNRPEVITFLEQEKFPIKVVLDNIRSGHNVGAAFRTSDAFNIDEIIIAGISPRPPHKEIFKAAIGSTESVKWSYHPDIVDIINKLKSEGYKILGIEQTTNSISLESFTCSPQDKIALIFGNEVSGISDSAIPLLDYAMEIPQWGTKHSLNVSVCLGIVLWEMVRGRV